VNLETKSTRSLSANQLDAAVYEEAVRWFALHVRSGRENSVAESLEGKGLKWFLPLRSRRRLWSDRIKHLTSPLFPGYIFCQFDARQRLPILKTPGVLQIVGYNRMPVPVDDAEIQAIQTLIASGLPNQPCAFMHEGDTVQIESGPLQGLQGVLMSFKGKYTVVLSVTLLQRSVAVEVDSAFIVTPIRGNGKGVSRRLQFQTPAAALAL
jgi:transcription antitermination factor NusG